jgi:hypothetical protein
MSDNPLVDFVTGPMLWFGLGCTIIAALVILLDWILLAVLDRSILNISYGSKSRVLVLFGWAFAAGVVGVFGAAIEIIQTNVQGAIAVAVGWPLIITRIVESNTGVQGTTQEEEEVVDQ